MKRIGRLRPLLLGSPRVIGVLEDVQEPRRHHFCLILGKRSDFHGGPLVGVLRSRVHQVTHHAFRIFGIMLHIVAHRRGGKLARPAMTPLTFIIIIVLRLFFEFGSNRRKHERIHRKKRTHRNKDYDRNTQFHKNIILIGQIPININIFL